MSYLERLILYKLRTTDPDELHDIAEIGQGLEHRLYKAKRSASLEELLQTIRTKRYPMARLRRILLHILLDIRTADIQNYPAYGRILAFNDTGRGDSERFQGKAAAAVFPFAGRTGTHQPHGRTLCGPGIPGNRHLPAGTTGDRTGRIRFPAKDHHFRRHTPRRTGITIITAAHLFRNRRPLWEEVF